MRTGITQQVFCLCIGVGLLAGCSLGSNMPSQEPVVALLPGTNRDRALVRLRIYLPSVVACPSTIELTGEKVSWVDLHSCQTVDLRRRVIFKDIQHVRLVWEKVSMGRDQRWVEVFQNKGWLPIGRGVGHLNNEKGIHALNEVKSALEQLSQQGRETPHRWKTQARSFLF